MTGMKVKSVPTFNGNLIFLPPDGLKDALLATFTMCQVFLEFLEVFLHTYIYLLFLHHRRLSTRHSLTQLMQRDRVTYRFFSQVLVLLS